MAEKFQPGDWGIYLRTVSTVAEDSELLSPLGHRENIKTNKKPEH